MPTYIMLTRVSPESLHQPKSFEIGAPRRGSDPRAVPGGEVDRGLRGARPLRLRRHLQRARHRDRDVSALIRSYGRAHSEIWPALAWEQFKQMVHKLPSG